MREYVLGIDGGTKGVRAAIYDLQGNSISFASKEYELYIPEANWAEQDPNEWWDSLAKAVRKAVKKADISPEQIIGLGADATSCSVVFLDENYEPLRRSIIWMDVRAAKEAEEITEVDHEIRKLNGWGNVSAEWMPCKALWVKRNQPDVYEKSEVVFEYIDWITYKLTGRITASLNNVSARWFYDNQSGGWPEDFYAEIGLSDLLNKFPEKVIPMGNIAGELNEKAAEKLGLNPGIPVAEGGADAFVGMIGLNAVRPGKVCLITGSSHLLLALAEEEIHSEGLWGSYADAVISDLHMLEGGQSSTGSIVQWFADNIAEGLFENEDEDKIFSELNKKAEDIPPGSEGLIMLEHFQGNRTPWTDPSSKGVLWGLSLKHKPEHIYRATLEGISFGTKLILEEFEKQDIEVNQLVASGGPTKSNLWMQIHSDVAGVPIVIPREPEAPSLGAAILGAKAGGAYKSIQEASDNMVQAEKKITPNEEKHQEYKFFYEKYKETYKNMKSLLHSMQDHLSK